MSCVEDAKSAIRWVRTNAALPGMNPDRICATGGSASGHIAYCTGVVPGLDAADESNLVSSVPNAMVLFNPLAMVTPLEGVKIQERVMKAVAGLSQRMGVDPVRISPIHHIGKGQPTTVISHGAADTIMPYVVLEEFTRCSTAAGNDVTLVWYQGAPHGFFNKRGGTDKCSDDSMQ